MLTNFKSTLLKVLSTVTCWWLLWNYRHHMASQNSFVIDFTNWFSIRFPDGQTTLDCQQFIIMVIWEQLWEWHLQNLSILTQVSMSAQLTENNTLQLRHNERNGVSNHQRLDCVLYRLFRRRSMKKSKLRVTGLLWGEFTGDRWIPHTKGQ